MKTRYVYNQKDCIIIPQIFIYGGFITIFAILALNIAFLYMFAFDSPTMSVIISALCLMFVKFNYNIIKDEKKVLATNKKLHALAKKQYIPKHPF